MQNIILATIFYASFQILSSKAALKMSDIWFLVIGGASTFILSVLFLGIQMTKGTTLGNFTKEGALYIFLANICITCFTLFLARSFQSHSPNFVIPIIFGSAIALSTLFTFIIQKNLPSIFQMSGIILVVVGVFLLSYKGLNS